MSTTQPKPLKIFFYSFEAIGHLNGCIGMAQALARRGHKIHFLIVESLQGRLKKYGFEEIVLKVNKKPQNPAPEPENNNKKASPENRLAAAAEKFYESGIFGPKNPLEKMWAHFHDKEDRMGPMSVENGILYNPLMEKILEREKPDLIIVDQFWILPAIQQANIPWVFSCSAGPLLLVPSGGKLPPTGSGYPTDSDPSTWVKWNEMWSKYRAEKIVKFQNELDAALNFEPKVSIDNGESEFFNSPYLNLYGYPEELDYTDLVVYPSNFVRIDAFIRDSVETDEDFKLPEEFFNSGTDRKLIYVSIGTLGTLDVKLMVRILEVLAKTPHRYIVSKGKRSAEYELPSNCWGQASLPQTRILPLVDLVITHGGNNTVCESLHFGKPMLVLPLMGDQNDNAQRVVEKGLGARLDTYNFEERELIEAIDRLLEDGEMQVRLKKVANRMQNSNSKERACERMEELVENFGK